MLALRFWQLHALNALENGIVIYGACGVHTETNILAFSYSFRVIKCRDNHFFPTDFIRFTCISFEHKIEQLNCIHVWLSGIMSCLNFATDFKSPKLIQIRTHHTILHYTYIHTCAKYVQPPLLPPPPKKKKKMNREMAELCLIC